MSKWFVFAERGGKILVDQSPVVVTVAVVVVDFLERVVVKC